MGDKKGRRRLGFFKRASGEFNLFLLRLKLLGEEVFSENQVISELFVESDSESLLDRLDRQMKGFSVNEEVFLSEYKKHQDLNKIYESYQSRSEVKSSSTVCSDRADSRQKADRHRSARLRLSDVIRSDEDTETEEEGERLWEERRQQWLHTDLTPSQIQERVNESRALFDQVPKDSFLKVYNNLVDKNKTFKRDRRVNLYDLMKVINAGWVAEDKWERAAKGLP